MDNEGLNQEFESVMDSVDQAKNNNINLDNVQSIIQELPSKFAEAISSNKHRKIHKVRKLLAEIEDELDSSNIQKIRGTITKAKEYVKSKDKELAVFYYQNMMEIYKLLSKRTKSKLFNDCVKLKNEIAKITVPPKTIKKLTIDVHELQEELKQASTSKEYDEHSKKSEIEELKEKIEGLDKFSKFAAEKEQNMVTELKTKISEIEEVINQKK